MTGNVFFEKMNLQLYLIRHGKTPGNEEKRYVGRTDESLSENGREMLLKKDLPAVSNLFSSPMKRCLESCECLYRGMEAVIIPEFREIDFGSFEGKNYRELSGNPEYQAWIDSGGMLPFPEGESRKAFIQRSLDGFWKMIAMIGKQEGAQAAEVAGSTMRAAAAEENITLAAVVHGGTIMAILSEVYGGDYYDYQIPNGDGYLIKASMEGKDFRILSVERI